MPAKKTKLEAAAPWYVKWNWYVFPVTPDGKEPLTPHGFKDASIDPEVISAWWDKWPEANIGLDCARSGVVALDADPARYDDYSREFMAHLMDEYPTAAQTTPSKGRHLIYMAPAGVKVSNSPGRLPPGIDVRSNGYILLAPSGVIYSEEEAQSKGAEAGVRLHYKWLDRPDELPPQPLPDHVLELLTKPEVRRTPAPTNGYHAAGETNGNYARAAFAKELNALNNAPVGGRNEQLNRSAFSLSQLVAGGVLDQSEVIDKLEIVAHGIGLEDQEIKRTIESAFSAGKTQPRGVPETPRLTFHRKSEVSDEAQESIALNVFDYNPEDGGLLDAWTDKLSDNWVFVTGYDAWYAWNESHWQRDETLNIHFQIEEMMHAMNEQARKATAKADGDEDKEKALRAYVAATKRSASRVGSVEKMARAKRTRAAAMLDKGNVLNVKNGTLDLDTMILRDHDRADMLTYTLPYEYDYYATCPRFRRFIDEVLVKEDGKTPDIDLASVTQELLGYSLTQDTNQEAMVWLAGEGGNGKTVMITVLSKLLGPLAVGLNFQTIGMAGNYDLAELPGKRIVFSTESERGGNMAEGYIKRIVSGETINARPIYGSPFFFQSTAKIWWAMNDKPTVKDTSNALYRRLKLIPFYRVFKEADRDIHLIDKLSEELPGILNWAIEGLLRLRRQGQFTNAAAINTAKDEFRYESNPIAQWLKERTEPGGATVATSAYENYSRWCTRSNNKELTSNAFGRELTRLNVKSERKRTGYVYSFTLLSESV